MDLIKIITLAITIYFSLFFIGHMENPLIITGTVFLGAIISLFKGLSNQRENE